MIGGAIVVIGRKNRLGGALVSPVDTKIN
jgi:hypothetical protein